MYKKDQREIRSYSNKQHRTYTLSIYHAGKLTCRYRTLQMNKEEFTSALNWTQNDWKEFLKTDEYYKI